ncbi:hypothetical protein [Actinoplanes awajinensis]|uniref:hypothetical protein n=1 Tax=Actinoplanes awajinensis TaxID=135946 RepID=UPI001E5564C1|nr:hypothetical protein [Actinoplanes awajinensis]
MTKELVVDLRGTRLETIDDFWDAVAGRVSFRLGSGGTSRLGATRSRLGESLVSSIGTTCWWCTLTGRGSLFGKIVKSGI